MRLTAFAILLAVTSGCISSHFTRGIEEPQRMSASILNHVPVGTPIEDAKRFMEGEGFKCSQSLNDSWGDRKGLDYLYCERSEGMIVSRLWKVAIIFKDGKVTEVSASAVLIGP